MEYVIFAGGVLLGMILGTAYRILTTKTHHKQLDPYDSIVNPYMNENDKKPNTRTMWGD